MTCGCLREEHLRKASWKEGDPCRVLKDGVGRRARGGRGEKAVERSGGIPQRPEVRGAGKLFLVSLRGDGESREGWGHKW